MHVCVDAIRRAHCRAGLARHPIIPRRIFCPNGIANDCVWRPLHRTRKGVNFFNQLIHAANKGDFSPFGQGDFSPMPRTPR